MRGGREGPKGESVSGLEYKTDKDVEYITALDLLLILMEVSSPKVNDCCD